MPQLKALRYLVPSSDSFWSWEDDGDTVVFASGRTLAFREQVVAALAPFENTTLPPLEVVLLILAATRDTWPEEERVFSEQLPEFTRSRPVLKHWWKTVLEALVFVHRLPRQIRSNSNAITTIIDIIVEQLPGTFRGDQTDVAKEVLQILSRPHWLRDTVLPDPVLLLLDERTDVLTAISRSLRRLTIEEILNRTATGLHELPVPSKHLDTLVPESEPVRTVREVLDDLRDDVEFKGLVHLVRRLSAVLTLPRDLTAPDELPQGGVSDITNRGPLDRLLLSELANDDDTLMTRIALNEALYIRRESPPTHPVRDRVLLIDSGIRMWGIPRVCAAAVALSLIVQYEATGNVFVYRSNEKGIRPVDFMTKKGLTKHMASIDCLAHPGELLDDWVEECQTNFGDAVDRVLITGEDVLADPDFRKQLTASGLNPLYVATVNRQGRVRLLRRSALGEKCLRELWVDLDEITGAENEPSKSLIDPEVDGRLPAILRLHMFPLRLSLPLPQVAAHRIATFPQSQGDSPNVLMLTRDRRLMLWDSQKKGALQISDRIPPGQLRWSGDLYGDGTFSLVLTRQDGIVHGVHITRHGGVFECRIDRINFWETDVEHIVGVSAHLGVLIFVLKRTLVAVDPHTGKRLTSREISSDLTWIRDRLFRRQTAMGQCWQKACYSNGTFVFDDVLNPRFFDLSGVYVVDIVGPSENPIAFLSSGELLELKSQQRRKIKKLVITGPCKVLGVSEDGNEFAITNGHTVTGETYPLGYAAPSIVKIGPTATALAHWSDPLIRLRTKGLYATGDSLFKKLSHVGVGESLSIVTKKKRRLILDLRSNGAQNLLFLRTQVDSDKIRQDSVPFSVMPAPAGVGYSLQQVTWSDGSRIVLDSRGLLHLQSSDRKIPELTLILNEKHVSGWCSTGQVWGRDFYLDDNLPYSRNISADQVHKIIKQFLERLP
ncbi:MAG: hypothetical protein FJ267_02835 [Planctomycetes bacterium]|nr:hypothetical protein [Planctomycetota bacterium]